MSLLFLTCFDKKTVRRGASCCVALVLLERVADS